MFDQETNLLSQGFWSPRDRRREGIISAFPMSSSSVGLAEELIPSSSVEGIIGDMLDTLFEVDATFRIAPDPDLRRERSAVARVAAYIAVCVWGWKGEANTLVSRARDVLMERNKWDGESPFGTEERFILRANRNMFAYATERALEEVEEAENGSADSGDSGDARRRETYLANISQIYLLTNKALRERVDFSALFFA
jgi:hypothetical protein